MKTNIQLLAVISLLSFTCCTNSKNRPDAHGNFEATEVIVSAEGAGKIMAFDIEEGSVIGRDKTVGYIDTIQLNIRKIQLQASIDAIRAKLPDIATQINVLKEQLNKALYEQKRTEKLVSTGAATTKQLDDINAQIELLNRQINATNSTLSIQTKSLIAEIEPLRAQIEGIEDMIAKSIITSPIDGSILAKFSERGELASIGKPLFKVADMKNIYLKAYVTSGQLADIKLGQQVKVIADFGGDKTQEYNGVITWIADKNEFTPKNIQTKDERENMVYAMKIAVENDGYIKLGMYGEVIF